MAEGKISEETAQFLISAAGQEVLSRFATTGTTDLNYALRGMGYPLEHIIGVITVVEARRRAKKRFPDAERLFFTGDALAQATSPGIAAYHARHLAPFGTVADLGCGVGMDAIALAKAGANVLAIDRDSARLVFARANAELCGVADRITFRQGDVTTLDWETDAAYWDPSRRDDAARFSAHADRYEPPLTFLEALRSHVRGGAVKLSPALPDDVLLPDPDGAGDTVEFLSENRECKEACLWFGEARGAARNTRLSAVLLPEEASLATEVEPTHIRSPGVFVFDPDPALIRAHALGTLTERYPLSLISADDAYLTGDIPPPARLATAYRIRESLVYRPRDLTPVLRRHGIGRLIIKKRHFSKEPDAVYRELGLKEKGTGGTEATLILVRDGKRFLALLCDRHSGVPDSDPAL